MKRQISVLVHFDQHRLPLSPAQFGDALQKVLACFAGLEHAMAVNAEIVSAGMGEVNILSAEELRAWQLPQLTDDVCAVTVVLSCPEWGVAVISGRAARHPLLSAQLVGSEQSLLLTIDQRLWRKVEAGLTNCVAALCGSGIASYAAIDLKGAAAESIFHANLRLLAPAVEAAKIDAETRIPGLYWAQYWSGAMLTEAVRQALLKGGGFIVRQVGDGLWVQTSAKLSGDSAEAHQAVYRIIQPQTYTPDAAVLAKYQRLQPWLFDRFPIEISAEIR